MAVIAFFLVEFPSTTTNSVETDEELVRTYTVVERWIATVSDGDESSATDCIYIYTAVIWNSRWL